MVKGSQRLWMPSVYGRRGVQRTGERRNPRTLFLAPIFIYPGEDEMGALMLNALSVLRGERTPKVYFTIAFSVSGTRRYPNKFDMVSH